MGQVDSLEIAVKLMKKGDYSSATKLLEGKREIYDGDFEKSFDYYLLFALACLYAGDGGTASFYFQKARNLKITDVNVMLGQAAVFLRMADTAKAIPYYLEVLDMDPQNVIANNALNFLKQNGDSTTIFKWVECI